jgi:hypothetical protein
MVIWILGSSQSMSYPMQWWAIFLSFICKFEGSSTALGGISGNWGSKFKLVLGYAQFSENHRFWFLNKLLKNWPDSLTRLFLSSSKLTRVLKNFEGKISQFNNRQCSQAGYQSSIFYSTFF